MNDYIIYPPQEKCCGMCMTLQLCQKAAGIWACYACIYREAKEEVDYLAELRERYRLLQWHDGHHCARQAEIDQIKKQIVFMELKAISV